MYTISVDGHMFSSIFQTLEDVLEWAVIIKRRNSTAVIDIFYNNQIMEVV